MERITKYSNDIIRNRAVNIIRKLRDKNGLNGDELAVISAFCLIERIENKALKGYEDLEKQGKLLRLPCAVGDIAYRINTGEKEQIIPMLVIGVAIRNENKLVIQTKDIEDDGHNLYSNNNIGKNVFFTIGEAEAALKELAEEDKNE